jgi:hypothetical protein
MSEGRPVTRREDKVRKPEKRDIRRHILVVFRIRAGGTDMRIPRITAAAVAACIATAVAATPAQAAPVPGPTLLVPAVQAVNSAQPTWVKAYWGTTRDICDAKVTVEVSGTDVLYPSNTATYTSFVRDDTLVTGSADYTAFQVNTTVDHTMLRAMHLTIGYRVLSNASCAGPITTRTFYATLPVLKA